MGGGKEEEQLSVAERRGEGGEWEKGGVGVLIYLAPVTRSPSL
jgi:hypothetical protein